MSAFDETRMLEVWFHFITNSDVNRAVVDAPEDKARVFEWVRGRGRVIRSILARDGWLPQTL